MQLKQKLNGLLVAEPPCIQCRYVWMYGVYRRSMQNDEPPQEQRSAQAKPVTQNG